MSAKGLELCVMLRIAVSSLPRSSEEVISHEMLLLISGSTDPLVETLLASHVFTCCSKTTCTSLVLLYCVNARLPHLDINRRPTSFK